METSPPISTPPSGVTTFDPAPDKANPTPVGGIRGIRLLSRLPPPPHRGSPSPRDSLESLPKLGISESIFTPSKGKRKEAREAEEGRARVL